MPANRRGTRAEQSARGSSQPTGASALASAPPKARAKHPAAESVTINVAIPRELHKRFKIKALTEGLNVPGAIAAAIEKWVA